MNIRYTWENPITARLAQRTDPLGWIAVLLLVFLVVALALLGPKLEWEILLVFGALTYTGLRITVDSHVRDWRQGRSLEEMLLALTPWQIVDGIAAFSLWRTAQASTVVTLLALSSGLLELLPGLPSLLSGAFALTYLATSGWPGLCLLLGFPSLILALQMHHWAVWVPVSLLTTGLAARYFAPQYLVVVPQPKAPRTRFSGMARLWSQNPIVVRELRREARATANVWLHRHGSFLLMMVLLAANLLGRGHLDPARLQWNACLLLGSLILLQSLRAAMTTSSAVVAERQSKTLESLALSGLSTADFVDGWAQLSWRPRMLENLVAALIALFLTLTGLALIPAHPPECSRYLTPPFQSLGDASFVVVPLLLLLPVVTIAGAYLGLLASSSAQTLGQASGYCLALLVLAGIGPIWLLSATGTAWSLYLASLPAVLALAALARHRLTEGRR